MARLFLLLYSVLCIACGPTRSAMNAQTPHKKIAEEKFGSGVEYFYNNRQSHVLCAKITRSTAEHPNHAVRFFVFDIKAGRLIFEDSMVDGEVQWMDATRIRVTKRFGMVTKSGERGVQSYVYDVVTQSMMDDIKENTSTE